MKYVWRPTWTAPAWSSVEPLPLHATQRLRLEPFRRWVFGRPPSSRTATTHRAREEWAVSHGYLQAWFRAFVPALLRIQEEFHQDGYPVRAYYGLTPSARGDPDFAQFLRFRRWADYPVAVDRAAGEAFAAARGLEVEAFECLGQPRAWARAPPVELAVELTAGLEASA